MSAHRSERGADAKVNDLAQTWGVRREQLAATVVTLALLS